ncbi:DUF6193 family natural product biosynthesis protein [Actinoplanes sp. URMC 104]|uniref:DUF6193 family natural product biosynthesis protein n=1 Tax=Actinoplanes sp. URMC 104 TaxID=3423409 RepID=UPI003F1DF411
MTDESVSPLDPELYPDLLEQDGLGPSLALAARRAGIDLDELTWTDDFFRLTHAWVETPHGKVSLHIVADRRLFGVEVIVDNNVRAWGSAPDLEQAVRVTAAWRDGSTVRELIAAYPFMKTDRFALGREDGNLLDVLWAFHLEDPGYEDMRPVLRAAHDDPRLSRLYPSVTHETLARFTVDPDNRENGQVAIWRHHDHYRVETSWREVMHSAANAVEAVRLASAEVPDTL